mmetsp:Transcript_25555/g.101880  ORF Transcript_25555/g.101880 Transcript_25555/m.101880 type:complete len:111 (+) Transcript_25555:8-340(+)
MRRTPTAAVAVSLLLLGRHRTTGSAARIERRTTSSAPPRCVDDPEATGRYVADSDGRTTFERGPHDHAGRPCRYRARWSAAAARCAVANERLVFVGDSTMRQHGDRREST